MNKLSVLLVVALTTGAGCTVTSSDRARTLADPNVSAAVTAQQVCASCHGIGGNAVSPSFPNLAGQSKDYLVAQLKAYRSHLRADPDAIAYMWGIATPLSDTQIEQLAGYYAAAAPVRTSATGISTSAAGQAIYQQGTASGNVAACASCHGAAAQGDQAHPRLAGQHASYLIKQLNTFQKTDTRPDGVVMKSIVHDMSAQNMKDVAIYLDSLAAKPTN